MALIRLDQLIPIGAIAGITLISGIACQSAETVSTPDETDETAPDKTALPVEPTQEISEPVPSESTAPAPTTPESAIASQPPTTAQQSCSASAFVADTDPAGLNVRSGPGSNFEVIDTLPTNEPVEVSIVGTTDGWFLLNEAQSPAQQELEQLGWVYAPLLGVTTTSLDINAPDAPAKLYASPDGASTVLAEIPKFSEVTLLSCSGDWLQVQTSDTAGWLAIGDQCSNPLSTCP